MKNIDDELVQVEFDRLLKIVDEAKGSDDPEKIENAAKESLSFISKLSGSEIAKWLMHEGQQSLPDMPYITSDTALEVGSSNYIKRAMAKLITAMSDILDAAWMSPEVLVRDFIEMSHKDGSTPCLLLYPKKGKGKKHNRDLKHAAKIRIGHVVYYEAGRKSQDVKVTFHNLNQTLSDALASDTKTWDRIASILSPDERKAAHEMGKNATSAHPDVMRFQDLWKRAMA